MSISDVIKYEMDKEVFNEFKKHLNKIEVIHVFLIQKKGFFNTASEVKAFYDLKNIVDETINAMPPETDLFVCKKET